MAAMSPPNHNLWSTAHGSAAIERPQPTADVPTTACFAAASAGGRLMTPSHWRRPNLHELLQAVYPYYNLIVWSATGNAQ